MTPQEQLIRQTIESRGIRDPRVLEALRLVPRHAFVPKAQVNSAYEDRPLPIGCGQTISQPYIVAIMSEAAMPQSSDRCLEIGTGSGYQTAVLSRLCGELYSIESNATLFDLGRANLKLADYLGERVHLRHGDGYFGWPEASPFDIIVVTAAPPTVCEPLLEQLALGGRLVIPVGPDTQIQDLQRWTRIASGSQRDAFAIENLLDVRFVPMLGAAQTR